MSKDYEGVALIVGLALIVCLYLWINHDDQRIDKKMCVDAGMTYVVKGDNVECVDTNH